jgi:DNA ligase (NAD+)
MSKDVGQKKLEQEILDLISSYQKGNAVASDSYYDERIKLYKSLYPKSEFLNTIKSFEPEDIEHPSPMLSLGNCFYADDVKKFIVSNSTKKEKILVMPKLDGLAIELHYVKNGNDFCLQTASTRGNGIFGANVTEQMRKCVNIPKTITHHNIPKQIKEIYVRGEAVILKKSFRKLKEDNPSFISSRNLVAGTIKSKDAQLTRERLVMFYAYSVLWKASENPLNFDNSSEYFRYFSEWFNFVDYDVVDANPKDIELIINSYTVRRGSYRCDMDGIVFAFDELKVRNRLGESKTEPKWAIAYKFPSEKIETRLIKIEWNTTRTGIVAPVAIFKPVEIAGAMIERATLHNLSYIEKMCLSVGDKIVIARQGDTIPKVIKNLSFRDSKQYYLKEHITDECPSCGLSTTILKSDEGIKTLYCLNPDCPAKNFRIISHWIRSVGIEFLGDANLNLLIENELVESIYDLYKLTKKDLSDIQQLSGKMGDKILESISASKDITLATVISGLGFEGIGHERASILCKKLQIEDIDDLLSMLDDIKESKNMIMKTDGFAETTANGFMNSLKHSRRLLIRLNKVLNVKKSAVQIAGVLYGMKFLVTGSVREKKQYYYDIVLNEGGKVASGVTKDLNFLICDEPEEKTNKYLKALDLNSKGADIKIITSKEFDDMVDLPF